MNTVTLRPATVADAPLLRRWDDEPHVLESDPNDDWEWETELAQNPSWREQLLAKVDGRPIGFVQIIDPALEESHYWGEVAPDLRAIDIWIGEADALGQGLGTQMMHLAIARCFADSSVRAILIDPLLSNRRAQRFYARLGFEAIEERHFGDDHCLVMELRRARWRTAAGMG